jgi:hypothetical protein
MDEETQRGGSPPKEEPFESIYFVSSMSDDSIVVDESDCEALNQLVARVAARCNAKIFAFSWLKRQMLLVVQVRDLPLFRIVQAITSQHARRINAKQGSKGRRFLHPFRALLLDDAEAVLIAVAAVHLSPTWDALADDPAAYRWSSHCAYLGRDDIPWLAQEKVLELLRAKQAEPLIGYHELLRRERSQFEKQRHRLERALARMSRGAQT